MSFLDIGCGSGIHALAALRLGAAYVLAIDVDADAIQTTRSVLERYAPSETIWQVQQESVFDLSPGRTGMFDVVYSWGVLHHTGDMCRAIRQSAMLVQEGGRFAFALYRRIWMDWFWKIEKRWYSQASPQAQARARQIYWLLLRLRLGQRFSNYAANYKTRRGMRLENDIHDWMGGWPYESISPGEVSLLMKELKFMPEKCIVQDQHRFWRPIGLFGSGCDEYVYYKV